MELLRVCYIFYLSSSQHIEVPLQISNLLRTGEDDIIDDVLNFFRANVLFRNFEIRGGADRTLIYLTLFTVMCLVKAEKIEDKAAALREFKQVAIKPFPIPGEAAFPLPGVCPPPTDKNEAGTL